jgi:hypothetical protein
MKAQIINSEEKAIARQRLSKHTPVATNTYATYCDDEKCNVKILIDLHVLSPQE